VIFLLVSKERYLRLDNIKCRLFLLLTKVTQCLKGIRLRGNRAIEALLKELAQLEDMNTFEPLQAQKLSRVQPTEALRVINLIKEKRDNSLKGRTCVDGRPQRKYISKEQAASPTVSTEAILCTLVVDAHENRYVATADVKGAYLHAEIDDYVILKLDGEVVDVFCKLNPRYKDTQCFCSLHS